MHAWASNSLVSDLVINRTTGEKRKKSYRSTYENILKSSIVTGSQHEHEHALTVISSGLGTMPLP